MDLSHGIKLKYQGTPEDQQRTVKEEVPGPVDPSPNHQNEAIFTSEVVDGPNNNLNDLINRTFKQKYDKFCTYEKKIRASELQMDEIMKKTNGVDQESRRQTQPAKKPNFDERFTQIMGRVEESLQGLRHPPKEVFPRSVVAGRDAKQGRENRHPGSQKPRWPGRGQETAIPDSLARSRPNPCEAPKASLKETRPRMDSFAVKKMLKKRMEEILANMPDIE